MDDVLREFLAESREHLDGMEIDLVALEQAPRDPDLLGRVFRAVHTIKGTCGFFGLPRLEELAHAGENVLVEVRSGALPFSRGIADLLLLLIDAVRRILAAIERDGSEGDVDTTALVAAFERVKEGGAEADGGDSAEAEGEAGGEPSGAPAPSEPSGRSAPHAPPRTLRIDFGLAESLLNLVGELVLSRNEIARAARASPALASAAGRLSRVTGDLHEAVLQTRMEPVGRLWGKVPRLARDLAALFEKQVRVVMRGQATELDRGILEVIADPLTHVVRNSLDHGIETPAERAAAGKPAEGRLTLAARQEGGQVVIEIADDGRGIDPAAVRRSAVERGLLDARGADLLDDARALQLVFEPGLTTAPEVTLVSGRGVGLDVVKANVERVGGSVELASEPGAGTSVRFRLPLTLAILPGVVVTSGGQRFVLQQSQVKEFVGIDVDRGIEMVHDAPVIRVRSKLLALVYLDRLLGLGDGGGTTVAVLETDRHRLGLVVDDIVDTEEIVVKPLGRLLEHLDVYAGATLLGDGGVALILDGDGIALRDGISPREPKAVDAPAPEPERRRALLVVEGADDARAVLPIEPVERLAEFPRADAVEFRGRALPLVDVFERSGAATGAMQVVVCARGGRTAGLVVDRIVDVVEVAETELELPGVREGVLGRVVLGGQVAEYLDVDHLVRIAEG